ncbi:MAG: MTAP family purine nucleoside phosphorylase [Planctomycetota bacterium]|jgi:5'-methylthioadenosine phosphorylase
MPQRLIGIIGGSGLGDAIGAQLKNVVLEDMDTPFGKPPSVVPYAANIFALKKLGVTTLIASGAVGSLQQEVAPGHLVLVDQFIDKTFRRQNTFFDELGAVHCEFAQPCCKRLREKLMLAAEQIDTVTHADGTYVCMEGPQFSTRAESLMHRQWGADLIGMTAMPEAKLAREAQMCYALIALASDYDCWREHDAAMDKQGLLAEIIGNLTKATQNAVAQNAVALIEKALKLDSLQCDDDCDCRKSLELAVWTAPETLDAKSKSALAPLFK